MFWFKPKEIVLDCFTDSLNAFALAKPDHAAKFIPDWWKKTPLYVVEEGNFFKSPTMKKCFGFVENYKHGAILPMWSDLNIEIGPIGSTDYRWQFADRVSGLSMHSFKQMNDYLEETKVMHIKLISPWDFRCKENVKWAWTSPTWNILNNHKLMVLPGITEYKYQYSTNTNMLIFRTNQTQLIEIPFRSPIAHVIPLEQRRLKIKHHLVSEDERKKLGLAMDMSVSFIRRYGSVKKAVIDGQTK